jgi:hypothetical protein
MAYVYSVSPCLAPRWLSMPAASLPRQVKQGVRLRSPTLRAAGLGHR